MGTMSTYQEEWRSRGYMSCCAPKNQCYKPTLLEKVCNISTHGVSIIPAIIAMYYMIVVSSTSLQLYCAYLYGTALVLLFLVSTIYHMLSMIESPKLFFWLRVFHVGDRIMIYLFIAASYMPWLLLQDFYEFGLQIAAMVWTYALAGTLFSLFFHNQYKTLETVSYLCLGFAPAAPLAYMSSTGIPHLALGGCLYVIGVFFFKSDGRIPCAHSIWHLLGSSGAWTHHYAIWMFFYNTSIKSSR